MKVLRLLIETNLFIAICAVAFMWTGALWLNLPIRNLEWLSLQVFFSTWFIYQLSRWVYFQKGIYANTEEWVVIWFEKHPRLNRFTIWCSGLLTIVCTLFLKPATMGVLFIVGLISLLYTVPVFKPLGINTRVRDLPYIKIFLIAFVWSVTAVLLPAVESDFPFHERRDIWLLLIAQFIFILFITLPFDINDAPIDARTGIRTIPSVFGVKASKFIALILGFIYAFLVLFLFMLENWINIANIYLNESTILLIWLILILIQWFTFRYSDKVSKWVIKLVYDGSMLVYFLILFGTITSNHG